MIDWVQVNTLREDVGRDCFDEIVEIFLEEVEEVVSKLRAAPDLTTLGDDLHFLKGSALNLGFSAFSKHCQKGESASTAGMPQDVDVSEIVASYETSKEAFIADMPSALNA